VISLNEFADVARRKLGWPPLKVMEATRDFQAGLLDVLPLTAEMQALGVRISYRNGLRIYDACIIASAALAGCGTLYTEDMSHGQVIEGVRIVNPFL
jgi:predicted nucleic acid-binding protein